MLFIFFFPHQLLIEALLLVKLLYLSRVIEQSLDIRDAPRLLLKSFHADCKVAIENFLPDLLYDSNAYVIKVIIPNFVGEKSVPQSHAICHVKILTHEQHYPAKGVKLRIYSFFLELLVDWLVNKLKHLEHTVAFSIYTVPLFVQVSQEAVLELTHQIAETEEDIRLEILCANLGFIAKLPEAIV